MIPFTEQYLVRKFDLHQDKASPAQLEQYFAEALKVDFELAEKFDSEDAALNTVLRVNSNGTNPQTVDIEIRFLCAFQTHHIRPSLDELYYMARYSLSRIHELLVGEFEKRNILLSIHGFPFREELIRSELVKELNEVYPRGKK